MNNIIVTKIEELYTVHSPKGRYFEMKERPCYGLSLCIDGQITYTHRGRTFVSDPGHAVLLPKGQSYALYGDKKGAFPVIDFQCTGFEGTDFMVFSLQEPEVFIKDFQRMQALEAQPLKQMGLFYKLLARLVAPRAELQPHLQSALHYIDLHWQESGLTNGQIAGATGISEVYLRKLFDRQFGTSPKQYILDLRLERAKQLLREPDKSVTAVAEDCGFSGVYHFCRSFKEKVGLTPTQYRKQTAFFGI